MRRVCRQRRVCEGLEDVHALFNWSERWNLLICGKQMVDRLGVSVTSLERQIHWRHPKHLTK